MKGVTAIVLAAGAASRMGQPKALLPLRGESLIRHVVRAASGCRAERVLVVLGGSATALRAELAEDVESVENPDWQEGLASSVRCGVQHAREAEAVILVLADQPLVRADVLDALLEAAERENCDVATCVYSGTSGPPALFGRAHFEALMKLRGDTGARSVLEAADRVAKVPFEEGALDIDSPEDYERLLRVAESLPL